MQPKVNVVDDSMSRIRLLERTVRSLRDELSRIGQLQQQHAQVGMQGNNNTLSEEASEPVTPTTATRAAQEVLEQENAKLLQKTEALMR